MTKMSDIETLQTELIAAIDSADTLEALEVVRVSALGKQGSVSALLKTMGGMSPEERQSQGPIINGLRERITSALGTKKVELETAELNRRLATERIDMTLPAPYAPRGTIHPVSQVMDELAEIFADMGFGR
jgi:phenylalanyl-tRNA synthetase alpha chain